MTASTTCTFKIDDTNVPEEYRKCGQKPSEDKHLCLFHDESILRDNKPENKDKVIEKLNDRIDECIVNNEPLYCIGYYLPDIEIKREFKQPVWFSHCKFQKANFFGYIFSAKVDFSGARFEAEVDFSGARFEAEVDFSGARFEAEVDFSGARFEAEVDFSGARFEAEVDFSGARFEAEADFYKVDFAAKAKFSSTNFAVLADFYAADFAAKANFSSTNFAAKAKFYASRFAAEANFYAARFAAKSHFTGEFQGRTYFDYVTFEKPNEVRFEIDDMSRVSFMNTDITGIRFSGKTRWSKDGQFKIIEEKELEEKVQNHKKGLNLEEILSVYRNLRENYEIRRRYDEAGKFFIREMEIKRKYMEDKSKDSSKYEIKENNPVRRNIGSLTGWYHLLSNYGESLRRPTLAGAIIVLLATLFFVFQSNPTLAPTLSLNPQDNKTNNNHLSKVRDTPNPIANSSFITSSQIGTPTHWSKAFVRSLGDFLPLLSMPSDIKIGLADYIIKIVGGAVTFGLIAIALRRRFERKYTH